LPISGGGGFLTLQQIVTMMSSHPRLKEPEPGTVYTAGIDLAGEREQTKDEALAAARQKLDSTVITIAEIDTTRTEPTLKVVEHYQWTGMPHTQVYSQTVDILKKWNCRRVTVDATGIGQPVASFLRKELGSRIQPFTFTQKSKSELAFEVLAFVNSSRLKLYKQDGSPEYKAMMFQLEKARQQFRPNQTMNFYVDPSEGHDDYLMSLALLVEGAKDFTPRIAKGGQRDE